MQSEGSISIDRDKYSLKNLITLLPSGFDFEEQMLQMTVENWENKSSIFASVHASIDGKLSGNPKESWLFSVGSFLSKAETGIHDQETKQKQLQLLQLLLQTAPENVKPALINHLKRLSNFLENSALDEYNPETGSKSRQELNEILERLSFLGR